MALKTFTKDVDLGTTSGQYGSKGHLILTVVENSIDTSTNTSNVTATLQFKVDQYSWRASTSNWSISGYKSASGSLAYQYYSGTITLWTDTFSVEHTNDGTKTISFNISFNSTNVYSGSDSLDCALTQIPRYASITSFVVSKRDETSVNVNWNADALCDAVWYSINNGSSWVQTSGLSFVISGLSANTSYNFKIRVRRSDSQLTTDSGKVSQTTYQYPYVDSVVTSNLQIGSQQELKIYNPLGRNVTVYMKQNNTSGTTLYSGTTNKSGNNVSYKFTPTSNVLYNSIPNGTSGNAVYYCTYSNQTVQTKSGTYYMDANSSTFKPTIESNSWNYATNYVNTETIIKGKSSITVTVSSSATPYTGASIVRYIVSCGNRTATITGTTGSATITNCSDSTVNIRAVDSRGYTQDSSKSVAVISYIDQTCTVDADRTDGVGSDVFLNLSGTYYNDKLYTDSSTQADNTILSVKYAISTTTSYTTDYTIPISSAIINDGSYNLSNYQIYSDGSSTGFTLGTRYNIRIKIQDRYQTLSFYGNITDGKIAVDCYQDSNGDYHRGINGLGSDDCNQLVNGTERVTKAMMIPKSGTAGYGLCNSDGVSIIRDHNNQNVSIGATGNVLFLGYQNTTGIRFFTNKATMSNDGSLSIPNGDITLQGNNINQRLYFQPNETFRIDEWYGGGYLIGAGKIIRFTIPLPKMKGTTTSVTITGGRLNAYSISGIIEDNLSLPNNKVEVAYYRDGYVTIFCTNSTAYATNFTPVGIQIDNLILKFS